MGQTPPSAHPELVEGWAKPRPPLILNLLKDSPAPPLILNSLKDGPPRCLLILNLLKDHPEPVAGQSPCSLVIATNLAQSLSIKASFLARDHPFICRSRSKAS